MSKLLFDIGSLCTKFNFVGFKPLMISSSNDYHIDFSKKGSLIEFYSNFPDCTADLPYYNSTFYSRSKIINKDKYSEFFGQCFKKLKCDPSDQSIIVLTPPVDNKEFNEKTAEILFETYNIPKLSMIPQSIFASEHKNFVSVLFGFSDTYIISHIDCKPCYKSLRHIPFGGHQITEFISASLKERSSNKYIDEDKFMWMAERVKNVDRFAFFDSDIVIDDFRHSTPSKTMFQIDPLTKEKTTFSYGYERYLATAFALYPEKIDPTIKNTLAEFIEDSINSIVKETKSKSSMIRHLKNKVSLVGGPASAKGIKYKLQTLLKSKKLKKKKSHKKVGKTADKNKDDDSKNKDEDSKDDDDDAKDTEIKGIDEIQKVSNEDPYLKDPITQLFRNASNYINKTGGAFVTNDDYKANGFESMQIFYL